MISLKDSVAPLRKYFNEHRGVPRFLAVVSPTCGPCLRGARAIRDEIIGPLPDADIRAGVVWIHMLPGDDVRTAEGASKILDDPRVTQFHDPQRRAGRAIASSLGWVDDVAWDVYLFYPERAEWRALPPSPLEWVHQLGGWEKADPDRFRTGRNLEEELRRIAASVLRGRDKVGG